MALDAALVVRAASGALWVAIGLFAIVVGRRERWSLALGTLAVAFGGQYLGINLAIAGAPMAAALVATALCYVALSVAAVVVAWEAARGDPAARAVLVVGLAAAGATALTWAANADTIGTYFAGFGLPDGLALRFAQWGSPVGGASGSLVLTLVAVLGVVSRRLPESPRRRGYVLAALAFGSYHAFTATAYLLGLGLPLSMLVPGLVLTLAAAAAWLVATSGPEPRVARDVALVLLAVALAGLLPWPGQAFGERVTVGILRTAGAAAFAYAVLRHDLLGVPLPRLAERRGVLAAGALASLFIVAQVAQEFLSAQYGLLMGGVVAGAFLFAAQPIQRALERGRAREVPVAAPQGAPSRAGAAYCAAVRAALADGAMTPDEEHHLAEVAEHLGLGPREALRLRREVARELSAGAGRAEVATEPQRVAERPE